MLGYVPSESNVFPISDGHATVLVNCCPGWLFYHLCFCVCLQLVATERSNTSENEKLLHAETFLSMSALPQTGEVTVV